MAIKTFFLDTEYRVASVPLKAPLYLALDSSSAAFIAEQNWMWVTAPSIDSVPGLRSLIVCLDALYEAVGETYYEWTANEWITLPSGISFHIIDENGQVAMPDYAWLSAPIKLSPIQPIPGIGMAISFRPKIAGTGWKITDQAFYFDIATSTYKKGADFTPIKYYTSDDLSKDIDLLLFLGLFLAIIKSKHDTITKMLNKIFSTVKEFKWWSWKNYMKRGMKTLLKVNGVEDSDFSSLDDTWQDIQTNIPQVQEGLDIIQGYVNTIPDATLTTFGTALQGLYDQLADLEIQDGTNSSLVLTKIQQLRETIGLRLNKILDRKSVV